MTSRPRSRRAPGIAIDILVQSTRWRAAPAAGRTVRNAIAAAAAEARGPAELSVVLTDDAGIRALNRRWRRRNEPTNVLSFASQAGGVKDGIPRLLGDIVIAYETVAREASTQRKPFSHHLAHLAVHGFLHLLGYDHDSDDDAEAMEQLERTILARLDVPDPYVARDAGT
jgi:probable rRNA maturation factor